MYSRKSIAPFYFFSRIRFIPFQSVRSSQQKETDSHKEPSQYNKTNSITNVFLFYVWFILFLALNLLCIQNCALFTYSLCSALLWGLCHFIVFKNSAEFFAQINNPIMHVPTVHYVQMMYSDPSERGMPTHNPSHCMVWSRAEQHCKKNITWYFAMHYIIIIFLHTDKIHTKNYPN